MTHVYVTHYTGVELHELILYLHQSGILSLLWYTDHKAYRITSELRLLHTILSKCKKLMYDVTCYNFLLKTKMFLQQSHLLEAGY